MPIHFLMQRQGVRIGWNYDTLDIPSLGKDRIAPDLRLFSKQPGPGRKNGLVVQRQATRRHNDEPNPEKNFQDNLHDD